MENCNTISSCTWNNDGTSILEIRKGFFKTKIYDKSILLIEPGNGIHTQGFIGLNFEGDTTYSTIDVNNPNKLDKTKFDFCFIHGFLLREIDTYYGFDFIKSLNIKCNTFVIDYIGEGYSIISDFSYKSIINMNQLVSCTDIKVLTPLDNIDLLKKKLPNINFFSSNIPGPRVFANPFNTMLHEHNTEIIPNDFDHHHGRFVYGGLKWCNLKKEKLYSCLNNRESYHRAFMVDNLLKSNINTQGIISCNFGENFNRDFDVYDYTNQTIKKHNVSLNRISLDENVSSYFGPNIDISKKCYIDVITETSPEDLMFITEKSIKPFLNLQFPIVFGPFGIITKLKEYGFDVFDDIINHDYDYVSTDTNYFDDEYRTPKLNTLSIQKSKMIVSELERLSNLDFHKIYLDSKDRLLYNQKLAHSICFDNNPILFDIGNFLFQDSIFYCYDGTFIKHYF